MDHAGGSSSLRIVVLTSDNQRWRWYHTNLLLATSAEDVAAADAAITPLGQQLCHEVESVFGVIRASVDTKYALQVRIGWAFDWDDETDAASVHGQIVTAFERAAGLSVPSVERVKAGQRVSYGQHDLAAAPEA